MLLIAGSNLLLLFVVLFINVIVSIQLEVGESCQPRNDISEEGICALVTNCEEAIRYIRRRDRHPFERCGFESSTEIVCCPKKSSPVTPKIPTSTQTPIERYGSNTPRMVDKHCKKIVNETLPPLDLHIIGGENALPGEFPHMAALGYLTDGEYDFSCGGTLISEYYILTAAHCVDNIEQKTPSIARLGVVEIGKNVFNPQTDIRIRDIINYPTRTTLHKYHDLALLRLQKPAQYALTLVPACLYTGETIPNAPLTVTGWGRIDVNKEIRSPLLQKANVTVVPSAVCEKNYTNWRKLPDGITDGQFCAGDPRGRTDACQGDSGGPIQALTATDGHYRIVGITSFGRGCGSSVPGVYTRIYPYLDWIESVVWPNGV